MATHLDWLDEEIQSLKDLGYYNRIRTISSAQGPRLEIDGRSLLNLCSNNYLGLANHPAVVEAGIEGLRRYGAGTASVRFISGTFECHRALEHRLAHFLGTESALT